MAAMQILSLDGGGIRGAFTAAFLAELEGKLNVNIADHFDLIAGTSTGGIIGIGLALGIPAETIMNLYQSKGEMIFDKSESSKSRLYNRIADWFWDVISAQVPGGFVLKAANPILRKCFNRLYAPYYFNINALLRTRYDSKGLETALKNMLGCKTLADAKTRIIVPAVDLTCGKPVVFKSPHLLAACSRDQDFSAAQIALATAAAPTYFPHVSFREGSAYCDGGLWANNPVMLAVAEVKRLLTSEQAIDKYGEITSDEIEILSIGTGRGRYSLVPPDSNAGLVWWGPKIMEVMSLSQAAGAESTARFILGDKLHRVDFDLPDKTWTLDKVEHIDQLIHFGREKAHEYLIEITPMFEKKPKYSS